MKKAFALLALSLVVLGCRREGPPGPPGPSGPAADFTVLNVTVQPNDWQPFGDFDTPDFQFVAGFDAPEITQRVFDEALVIGYLIDNGVAFILPNTINFGDFITEFSMIHAVGVVEFIAKDSDLQTEPPQTAIDYRVYIIDAAARIDGMEDWDLDDMEAYVERMESYND